MSFLEIFGLLLLAYLVGSIPFGFLLVKIFTGQDVRNVESGRTGGTNSMRAAGFPVGLATSILDILKSAGLVWLAKYLYPDGFWLHVFSGFITVVGHNYSIYLIQKDAHGKLKIGGGAGGTPAAGVIVGLWWPSFLILVPTGFLIVMVIGYASLATMSLPLIGSLIFLIRYLVYDQPWQYILTGLLSEILILWALRPNIKRLLAGTERLVGFRSQKKNRE
ncbi:MAG TPA: glycerol-3-phosphate acyltransferase [Chloroflexi bacterium]|nr:glycerol-3-phosphate acyltransferase [Chloroflexota bacterium]